MSIDNPEYWPFSVVSPEQRTPHHHAVIAFLDDALREGFRPCKFVDGEYRIEAGNGRCAWVIYRGHTRGRTATRWEIWLNDGNERVTTLWANDFAHATTAALEWVRGGHIPEVIAKSLNMRSINLTTLLSASALQEEVLAELLAAQFDAYWFPNYHRFSIDTEDAVVYVDFDDSYSARLPEEERQYVSKTLGFLPAIALRVQANPVHSGSAQLAQRVADVLAQQFRVRALAR